MVPETAQLCISLRDLGIGLPHLVKQVALRVESSVLHGCEPLASASVGWPSVAKQLNNAHYRSLKSILAIEGASLGTGGYARLLLALGLDLRLASKVALRILSARGRLFCLPSTSAIPGILRGAAVVTAATWLDDSLDLLRHFNIPIDFPGFEAQLDPSLTARHKVKLWLRECVLPALLQFDSNWLKAQEPKLFDWLRHGDSEKRILASLAPAQWSKREWLYVRAWYLTRLSGHPGLFVFGKLPPAVCPFCGQHLTAEHFLLCQSTGDRSWSTWLEPSFNLCALREKILYVGRHAIINIFNTPLVKGTHLGLIYFMGITTINLWENGFGI